MTSGVDAPTQFPVPPPPGPRQKLRGWAQDYWYVAYWMARGAFGRRTPEQLLEPLGPRRPPILLLPGVYENWRFMQPVADHVHAAGHPVHVLDKLGYNTGAIPAMAEIAAAYLVERDLTNVTIIAHSKGGLIGKYALIESDVLHRVSRLIAINTPFSGSTYAGLFLLPSVRMFMPAGPMIHQLLTNTVMNSLISSLYSVFDPHIPQTSRLEGAENIVLPTTGHFRPMGDPETLRIIDAILARSAPPQSSHAERCRRSGQRGSRPAVTHRSWAPP